MGTAQNTGPTRHSRVNVRSPRMGPVQHEAGEGKKEKCKESPDRDPYNTGPARDTRGAAMFLKMHWIITFSFSYSNK